MTAFEAFAQLIEVAADLFSACWGQGGIIKGGLFGINEIGRGLGGGAGGLFGAHLSFDGA